MSMASSNPSAARGDQITAPAASSRPASTAVPGVFYYVDGYHGGVDGHMPPDSL
ncbi:MAG: hypothetical protein JWM57_460, partial [Phycisphaerales bacterium]|nr:hypothetical protein [Phycisphaerales bacterium]